MTAADAHVDGFVRTGLGLPASSTEPLPALPDALRRLLLRTEEYECPHRDQWGNWEFGFGSSFRRGRLLEPEIDIWLAAAREELAGRARLEPLWPDGHRFAMCLSHDVDLVSESMTPAQVVRSVRSAWAGRGDSLGAGVESAARGGVRAARAARGRVARSPATDALERCVAIERDYGVSASYFFTVYDGANAGRFDCVYAMADSCTFRGRRQPVADLVATLHSEGFDVGLHGSYRSAAEDGALAREKRALEQATGLAVTTTRQHFLRWDVRRTPRLQSDAGFTADATLGFNRSLGFRAGTGLPFRHFDLEAGEPVDILLAPLAVHDTPLFRSDGLELDRELARDSVRDVVDAVAAAGGLATFLVHPNNLDRPDDEDLFRWAIRYGLERGAWFASLGEIDRWWRRRERRLLAP